MPRGSPRAKSPNDWAEEDDSEALLAEDKKSADADLSGYGQAGGATRRQGPGDKHDFMFIDLRTDCPKLPGHTASGRYRP